jgi:hypothetical protein
MPTTQNINNIRLSGTRTFDFVNSQPGVDTALVTIDRTVNQGLNSLSPNDTLTIEVQRSLDGVTWAQAAAITCLGGALVVKGVTLAEEQLSVGLEEVGEAFRIITTATSSVRIAGTVVYSP